MKNPNSDTVDFVTSENHDKGHLSPFFAFRILKARISFKQNSFVILRMVVYEEVNLNSLLSHIFTNFQPEAYKIIHFATE